MNLHKQFATNAKTETAGIRVEYYDENDVEAKPATFIVARAGGANTAYQKALDRETRPIRRALSQDAVSIERINFINKKVFVETCLLGWENVSDPDGKPLAFTPENALQLFKDLPDLYDDVVRQASNANLFRLNIEEDAKN